MDKILTFIIGKRSNLSNKLYKSLKNSILVSSEDIENNIELIFTSSQDKINIIFNNFQVSTLLNKNESYDEYIIKTILNTSRVLAHIQTNKIQIDKIIYTSSSSVYGDNGYCTEEDSVHPISLQASLKVANEELIKRFCNVNSIKFTIIRLFNMYGGDDNFSIVSKIKDAYVNNTNLNVINNGNAVRDYIYIEDVVKIYIKLLDEIDNIPNILNVAKGDGQRLVDILDTLDKQGIKIKTNNLIKDEILTSIANITKLNSIIDTTTFRDVEKYLLEELSH